MQREDGRDTGKKKLYIDPNIIVTVIYVYNKENLFYIYPN